ncbi:MAG: AAA family ATPase [Lachnospiraceae bacterium]
MTEKKLMITIARQYGSGGREIGTRLAEELGLNYYDKNILRVTSDASGIKESYFHLADERPGNRLLCRIVDSLKPLIGEPSYGSDLVTADNLFRFQSEVIRQLAKEESCIFIGRCANYILDGTPGLVRIFIYADLDNRIERIREKRLYEDKDIAKNIKRIDKERWDYHRYYTGKGWDGVEGYDLMINTSTIGIEGAVTCIKNYITQRGLG